MPIACCCAITRGKSSNTPRHRKMAAPGARSGLRNTSLFDSQPRFEDQSQAFAQLFCLRRRQSQEVAGNERGVTFYQTSNSKIQTSEYIQHPKFEWRNFLSEWMFISL